MQEALVRAFAMKPTNNDIDYMQSKTEQILNKITMAVIFAKEHDEPEILNSHWLICTLPIADYINSLTRQDACSKNRTIKPKVYSEYIRMLEDYTSYIHYLFSLALGNEGLGPLNIEMINNIYTRFQSKIEENEIFRAKIRGDIDWNTYMEKVGELDHGKNE